VMDVGGGELGLHGVASHVLSASQKDAPGIPTREYKGLAGQTYLTAASAAFMLVPEWKVTVDAGYRVGGFDLNLRWRYIDSVRDGDIESFVVPSRQYLDVTAGYAFESGILAGLSMRAGVTNLTDETPPVYPSSAEANTEPSTYDALGRRYFLRGIYRF